MRVLVLVARVPDTLQQKKPWHFFQELEPLAAAGHRIRVLNAITPAYELPGVEIHGIGRRSLRGDPLEWLRAAAYAGRHWSRLPRGGLPGRWRDVVRLCQWNLAVAREIADFRPDVIHSHWAEPHGSAGSLAAVDAGVPLVMTLRGHEHIKSAEMHYGSCLDPFYEETLRRALAAATLVTICCSDSRRRLAELGIDDDGKIRWIYHAVNQGRFDGTAEDAARVKRELGLEGRRVITCVAIIDHARKGHATLLEAFRDVHARHPDTVLLLVGDGPVRPQLERRAAELGLAAAVRFAGSVHPREVQHHIRLAELTVLPTHCEVFGNVVFESLILGVPVISGAAGAARDVLPLGPYGRVFPPGDAAACRDAILDVLADPVRHRAEAAAGREYVLREMSLERRIAGFIATYEAACGRKGSS